MSNQPRPCGESVERLLTYRQAGERLGVTERTVWTHVDRARA
jgi:DNA-directed RNA polymerase specialized sigma24 family protein